MVKEVQLGDKLNYNNRVNLNLNKKQLSKQLEEISNFL